jgi:hypothetical protein
MDLTKNVTSNTSGPVGSFNQSGNGAAGGISGSNNCGGDNCRIGGSTWSCFLCRKCFRWISRIILSEVVGLELLVLEDLVEAVEVHNIVAARHLLMEVLRW